jgi:hypothetical protein
MAAVAVATAALVANADVLHLNTGGSIEGKIVEQTERGYKVRTVVGTITVPADVVENVEEKPSVLDEYEALSEQVADTPAAQVELAAWCEENGLKAPSRKHLKIAMELDPDFAPARTALGFVRVAGMWVEGRSVAEQGATDPSRARPAGGGQPEGRDEEQVVEAIQAHWSVRIAAIKKNMLESSVSRQVQEGRRKIVAIRDPLAILPLARLLSRGSWACRDALVEALSNFPQDEATLNLAALALVDGNAGIRRRALVELQRRDDPRVIPQFRRALHSDSDRLIRRAATGLGALEAQAAVLELIDVLRARRRQWVEVPVRRYFGEYPITFDTPTVITFGHASEIRHNPMLGVPAIGGGFVIASTELQVRDVTVFRTEVLEALKVITGENFGFDEAAWRRWYEEQQP